MLLTWGSSRGGAGQPSFALGFADLGLGAVDTSSQGSAVTPTFTRATTSTTILSTGLVASVASGTARSYYDPTSLAYLGYLAEGSRVNLCLQSEDLTNGSWAKTRSTTTGNAIASPDGTVTADKLVEDATAASTHLISQSITFAATTAYTFSVWLKASERTFAEITMFDGVGSVGAFFNLTLGTAGTVVGTATSTIKAHPNGWYRATLSFTSAGGAGAGNAAIFIAEADNDVTFDGNGTSGIFVWGAQVEAASFASSYMPTTVASFTRNADVLTYPLAAGAAGTLAVTYTPTRPLSAVSIWVGAQLYTDGSNLIGIDAIGFNASGPRFLVVNGGATQASPTALPETVPGTNKAAGAFSANDFAFVMNGGTPGTDTSGTIPSLTTLGVGVNFTGALQPYAAISRIAYFPNRLDNSALVAMTA